jgi:molecular chaperone DnaJ
VAAVKADYYDVLGVDRDADEEAIRRAFDAGARTCHPEVSDDPADHRRFRELAEAYGVLSSSASRLLYDRYGYRARGNHAFGEDMDKEGDGRRRGQDVHAPLELEWFEAEEGARKLIRYPAPSMCAVCDGRGVLGEPDPECDECLGMGQIGEVDDVAAARIPRIEMCPLCGVDPCDECGCAGIFEAERLLRVRIPLGVKAGDQLRVAGEGGIGERGGPPGDLLLEIDVTPEPRDARLVRYLALAGLVVAVGLLVAYLLLA